MHNFIETFIALFVRIYSFLIFFRVVMSWIRMRPNVLTLFISDVTDPYLNLIKRFIPPLGMIDFSPIIALLLLDFAGSFVIGLF